jgi:multidrug efflux pump subunit AcrB
LYAAREGVPAIRRRWIYVISMFLVMLAVIFVSAFALLGSFFAMSDLGVSTTLASAAAQEGSLLYLLVEKPIGLLQLFISTTLGFVAIVVLLKLLGLVFGVLGTGLSNSWKYLEARFFDHRIWVLGIGYFAFLLTIALFSQTPFQFNPETDDENSRVEIETVPGTTLETAERITSEVATLLYEQPEVELALERTRDGNASIFITLKADRERTRMQFERELAPQLAEIADARVRFRSLQGFGGPGSGRAITIMLAGSDPDLLNSTAVELVEEMKGLESLVAPRITADVNRPEIIIRPRADLLADLGVSTIGLSQTIRIATMGEIEQNAAKFSLSDRQIPIIVKLPESSRRDLETIKNLPVPTARGGTVPLGRIAEVTFGAGPTTIQRYNQNRRVFIGADLSNGVLRGNAMEAINNLPTLADLPQGVIRDEVGEDELELEVQENFSVALFAGVLLVFAVLVLLYKRLMSPLVNMVSLALAPLGGIFLVWIVGQPTSMPVLIGILLLLGIVSKNSILLIDFAIDEMKKGTRKRDAILDAGHKRAQPIVMTTVAMTAGMVPTALSLSGDGAFRQPMGVVVIGGLIMSTVLTLLIVPAGFSLADGMERRMGPWLRNKFLTYRPGDDKGENEAEAVPAE